MVSTIILIAVIAVAVIATFLAWVSRYKRCPSDKALVVYGKTAGDKSARIVQGGAVFVWPVIQDYSFLDLKPMPININLTGALSKQNIRMDIKSNFTIAIAKSPDIILNAAQRLLGLADKQIVTLSEDLITGQMRLVVATMNIEEINSDRETFLKHIQQNVETELNKVGLTLINVNISDIRDESGYIAALGKEAAAKATNDAKVSVAQKTRDGDTGEADANQDRRIKVAQAESTAKIGEAEATAKATEGENLSAIKIAESNAERKIKESSATAKADAAKNVADAEALKKTYQAQKEAEEAKAEKNKAEQNASTIVQAEIAKEKATLDAEAEAEKIRRKAQGEADGILAKMAAQADGEAKLYEARAKGYKQMVDAVGGDAAKLATLLISENLPEIIKTQAEAIKNIKIDKITVWDGGNSTANFAQSLLGALPPLTDAFKTAGAELPGFLQGKENKNVEIVKS